MKDSEKLAGLAILLFAGIPGIIAISAVLKGFVLTKLWVWFIVPLFGFEPLRMPFAIGLAIVVGFLTHQVDNTKSENKTSIGEQFIATFIRPFVTLGIGYFVQMFI